MSETLGHYFGHFGFSTLGVQATPKPLIELRRASGQARSCNRTPAALLKPSALLQPTAGGPLIISYTAVSTSWVSCLWVCL